MTGGGDDALFGGSTYANAPGTAYLNLSVKRVIIPIAGALLVRLRGKFTGGGALSFRYLRPASVRPLDPADGNYAYSTGLTPPHADVAVVADTEFQVDIAPGGESDLEVTFTASADGAVTWFDVMQQ